MSLPTPYYEEDGITIYHADCRQIVGYMPKVDLILTDPPYGIAEDYTSLSDQAHHIHHWANVIDAYLGLASVVSVTPGNGNQWAYPRPTWTLCWFNRAGAGSGPWGFSCWQPILCYGPDPYLAKGLGRRPDYIEWSESSEVNGHPCPKPLGFVKQWMQRVSHAGTVLDPFMGSGTTLRAAKDLGRKAIGIEIEERYCEIAANRLAQTVLPLDMIETEGM